MTSNQKKILAILAAALVVVLLAKPDAPDGFDAATVDMPWPAEQEVTLVDVADTLDAAARAEFVTGLPGATLNSVFSAEEGLYRLDLPASEARALAADLHGDPRVEFVEPEFIFALDATEARRTAAAGDGPDDPLYPFQWHLEQIDVEGAWKRTTGRGVTVAVIDTGVAFDDDGRFRRVRDLAPDRFVGGYDFVSDDDAPFDEHGHGTHVAGTIAQTTNNAYGVAGVAPDARIMPIRVLDARGRGNTADIAESIRWAADNGADVINMSLGGPVPSRIMQDAVDYAHRKGVTVIAAAGNNGWSMPSFPAAYRNVIAVSATQFDRTTTFYSNYGRYIDIAAPGGNTRVDQNGDGRPDGVMQETIARQDPTDHEFALYMGTSMASPHVAGVAALLHAQGVTHPERVASLMQDSATEDVPTYDRERYGAGLIDARAAAARTTSSVHLPRGAAAALAVVLLLGWRQRSGNGRPASTPVAAGVAAFVAAGLAPLLALLPVGAWAASLGASPLYWAGGLQVPVLGGSALLFSALPAVGLYALFGGVASRRRAGVLIGALVGVAALLAIETISRTVDITGIPGVGLADTVWLGANALAAGGIALVAARRA